MRLETAIGKAKKDISENVVRVKTSTGLPMFLMELIVAEILGDIREESARELAEEMIREEKGGSGDVKLRREQTNVHAVEESREAVHEDEQSNEKEAGEI